VPRSGRTLVAIAKEPGPGSRGRDDVHSLYFVVRPDEPPAAKLASLVDDGQLRPAVSAVFGLESLERGPWPL
jgi:hypothetical protein